MKSSRRAFLASISAVALGGCVGSGRPSGAASPEAPPAETRTESATPPTTEPSPTTTPAPEYSSTTVVDIWEVTYRGWRSKEYIRYYHSATESLKKLYPSNGLWVWASISVTNIGGEPAELPRPDAFKLVIDGEALDSIDEMPRIDWNDIRFREGSVEWSRPGYIFGRREVNPEETSWLSLIVDVASVSDPLIKWASPRDEPVVLARKR